MTNNTIMKQSSYIEIAAMAESHLPLCLLIDTSLSMNGQPLQEVIEGYNNFITQTASDETAKKRVDIAVMTFSGAGVKMIRDFMPISKAIEMPQLELKAEGNTPMGEATDDTTKAKELIRQREDGGRLKFFSVAVNNANTDALKSLSPRVIQCTKENDFKGLFDWLAASMTTVSASRVSDNPALPDLPENFRVIPSDW